MSGDGRRALSGSDDRTVRVWDVESGACLRVLEGHSGLRLEAWRGRRRPSRPLRLGRHDGAGVGRRDRRPASRASEGHTGAVRSVACGGDGRRALSGSADKTVRVWDVETGRLPPRRSRATPDAVVSVAWRGDGRRALSGSDDHTVRVWDVETGACLRALEGHTGAVWSVAWRGDGRRALSGSDDQTVRVWDVETGACLRALEGHTGAVWSVAWSADGEFAFSGADNGVMRVWDLRDLVSLPLAGRPPVALRDRGRSKSSTPTPRSSSSARAARARRGSPSGPRRRRMAAQRLDGRRLGDALEAARVVPATASSGRSGSGISAARPTSG